MNLLFLVIFGAIVGWLASVLMKTNAQQGFILDVVVGIVGSVLGGVVMSFLGMPGVTGFNIYSIAVGVIGAILLIAISRMFFSAYRRV